MLQPKAYVESAAFDAEPHRILLPGEGKEWSLWRSVCLRGSGFPVSQVLRLAAPPAAAAADRLRAAEDNAERCRNDAQEALSREIARAGRADLDGLIQAVQKVKKGKVPAGADLPAAARDAVDRYAAADAERKRFTGLYLDCFAAESERLSGELQEVSRDSRFREAVLWQNRRILATGIDRLAGRGPSSKHRQHELVVVSYLQRFCTKNDTIGFFGPVGWASLGDGEVPIAVQHGPGFLAERRVFFEGWCIDAVAATLAADPALRLLLAPRRGLFVRSDGEVLGRARLAPELRALLALSDGLTPARDLGQRLVAARIFPDTGAVERALLELEKAGLLTWGFDLPVVLDPERALAQQLEILPAGEARDAALHIVGELGVRRQAVARAAGDAPALDAALEQLERRFTEVTGREATRGHGQSYAGRTLVYEDCRRGTEVAFGADVLAALAPPLTLVLTSARWLTWKAAELHRQQFDLSYQQVRRMTGVSRVPLATFCRVALPVLFNPVTSPIAQKVMPQFWQRWSRVLDLRDRTARQVSYTSAELRSRVLDAFAAPGPGWPMARHHSPDILLAASGPEAILRGDYRFVLGEIHVAANTLSAHLFVAHHPNPAELVTGMERDVPESCVFPTLPKSWRQEEADALLGVQLPGLSGRLDFGLATGKDLYLEVTPAPPGLPRERVLSVLDLFVEPGEDGLEVVSLSGRRFDLLAFLQTAITAQIAGAFRLFPPATHLPRILVDRLILWRESWSLEATALQFGRAATPAERFRAACRWADRCGLPRLLFVKAPHERKPFFLDLESPLSVEIFSREIRRSLDESGGHALFGLSEMVPGPEESWLPDAEGERYVSELRMVAVDRTGEEA